MPNLRVLYFASARECAGLREESVPCDTALPVSALLEQLVRAHPALERLLPHLRISVNQEFVERTESVPPGAEVALIPPVAGGSAGLFRVVTEPLSLDEVVRAVSGPARGGLVTFTGMVRSETQGRRVLRLEYEAYDAMAVKTLAEIAEAAQRKWPLVEVAIVHRKGLLIPGDAAVVIAASAPHRKEAFLACEFAIEKLKEDVPIWKKEFFEDGSVWVGMGP
jgi:MoaE-MoaD fusion protein